MFVGMWLVIGAGMLTLLLAAISRKNKGECSDYTITIKGAENNFFIDKKSNIVIYLFFKIHFNSIIQFISIKIKLNKNNIFKELEISYKIVILVGKFFFIYFL